MVLYDTNGWLGNLINLLTVNVTGDQTVSILVLVIIFALLLLTVYRIGIMWTVTLLSIPALVLLAYSGEWLAFFGVLAIFISIWVARNWITN